MTPGATSGAAWPNWYIGVTEKGAPDLRLCPEATRHNAVALRAVEAEIIEGYVPPFAQEGRRQPMVVVRSGEWWLRYSKGPETGTTKGACVLALILAVGLLAGCGEHTGADFSRANTVCAPAKTLKIVQHVHEFPSDNWLEVKCSDGTTRAVQGG